MRHGRVRRTRTCSRSPGSCTRGCRGPADPRRRRPVAPGPGAALLRGVLFALPGRLVTWPPRAERRRGRRRRRHDRGGLLACLGGVAGARLPRLRAPRSGRPRAARRTAAAAGAAAGRPCWPSRSPRRPRRSRRGHSRGRLSPWPGAVPAAAGVAAGAGGRAGAAGRAGARRRWRTRRLLSARSRLGARAGLPWPAAAGAGSPSTVRAPRADAGSPPGRAGRWPARRSWRRRCTGAYGLLAARPARVSAAGGC